ncbi:hypothetical protein JW979_04375, partial [bacterium]|nr:hypothetical protein [candidate division CSSED10-310 bacterium]
MNRRKRLYSVFGIFLSIVLSYGFQVFGFDAGKSIEVYSCPANQNREFILDVPSFGYYSFQAESDQGVALQLIDRMSGPGGVFGEPGTENGRIDTFLEKGHVKLRVIGDPLSEGEAVINVVEYVIQPGTSSMTLQNNEMLTTELRDCCFIVFEFNISQNQKIFIDAAGRSLKEARIWRNGSWLCASEMVRELYEGKPSQPLQACRLYQELSPGDYHLVLYGGSPLSWPEESDEYPLFVRMGIRSVEDNLNERRVMNNMGVDRWVVSGSMNYFRLDLLDRGDANIVVSEYTDYFPLDFTGITRTIYQKDRESWKDITTYSDPQVLRIVSIYTKPGNAYRLVGFNSNDFNQIYGSGDYWMTLMHSGFSDDIPDVTAILVKFDRRGGSGEVVDARVIEMDSQMIWHRKFNVQGTFQLFVNILEPGYYAFRCGSIDAQIRVEPFFIKKPPNYSIPAFKSDSTPWLLDNGYYIVTVNPIKPGIMDLVMASVPDKEFAEIQLEKGLTITSLPLGYCVFPKVNLENGFRYSLYINQQPEIVKGLVKRKLPIDLTYPLIYSQNADSILTLDVTLPEQGSLQAVSDQGENLDVFFTPEKKYVNENLQSGRYSLFVKPVSKLDDITIVFNPNQKEITATSRVDMTGREAEMLFPGLECDKTIFTTLSKNEQKTFLFKVNEPAFYQIESTGLLAMHGQLRTRTILNLADETANGSGRNFKIQQFLREGDYQITVNPTGQSAGHCGIRAERSDLQDAGNLHPGDTVRLNIKAGQGAVFNAEILHDGKYTFHAEGLNKIFACRLDDAANWPVIRPGTDLPVVLDLDAGYYPFLILPKSVESRCIVSLNESEEQVSRTGHGPFNLKLGRWEEGLWIESQTDSVRTPDCWLVDMPASADVLLDFRGEVDAVFEKRLEKDNYQFFFQVLKGKNWQGRLPEGQYRCLITASRKNNLLPYQWGIFPEQLVNGQVKSVKIPAAIDLEIGSPGPICDTGFYEIGSRGKSDVKASLYDKQGKFITSNDDRYGDWNFLIGRTLSEGTY